MRKRFSNAETLLSQRAASMTAIPRFQLLAASREWCQTCTSGGTRSVARNAPARSVENNGGAEERDDLR